MPSKNHASAAEQRRQSQEDESIDSLIDKTRKQLERLRGSGSALKQRHADEWKEYQNDLSQKRQSLQTKLSSRSQQSSSSSSTQQPYLAILRHLHSQSPEELIPQIVLRLEASLLQAMHMTFLVYPTQEELIRLSHDEQVCDYLYAQRDQCTLDQRQVEHDVVEKVSRAAQENHRLYDSYQERLEELQREIRRSVSHHHNHNHNHQQQQLQQQQQQLRTKELPKKQYDDFIFEKDDNNDDADDDDDASTTLDSTSHHSESTVTSFSMSSSSSSWRLLHSWSSKLHDSVSSFVATDH